MGCRLLLQQQQDENMFECVYARCRATSFFLSLFLLTLVQMLLSYFHLFPVPTSLKKSKKSFSVETLTHTRTNITSSNGCGPLLLPLTSAYYIIINGEKMLYKKFVSHEIGFIILFLALAVHTGIHAHTHRHTYLHAQHGSNCLF